MITEEARQRITKWKDGKSSTNAGQLAAVVYEQLLTRRCMGQERQALAIAKIPADDIVAMPAASPPPLQQL